MDKINVTMSQKYDKRGLLSKHSKLHFFLGHTLKSTYLSSIKRKLKLEIY